MYIVVQNPFGILKMSLAQRLYQLSMHLVIFIHHRDILTRKKHQEVITLKPVLNMNSGGQQSGMPNSCKKTPVPI
jgi:hypothetical protein